MADDASPVCSTCGLTATTEAEVTHARLTWSSGLERGRRTWTCERCARENLRGIEGKLDSQWW